MIPHLSRAATMGAKVGYVKRQGAGLGPFLWLLLNTVLYRG